MSYKMLLEIRLTPVFEDIDDVEGEEAYLTEVFQKWASGLHQEYPKELGDFRQQAKLYAIDENGTRWMLVSEGWVTEV